MDVAKAAASRHDWWLLALPIGAASLTILVRVTLAVLGHAPASHGLFDDAYMYVRYAENLLRDGRLCWNPGGHATYGLTSPLFLAVVLPLRFVLRDPTALMTVASVASGVAFLATLPALVMTAAGRERRVLWMAAVLVCVGLAMGSEGLAVHFVSGMDTLFAMAYLGLFLVLAVRGRTWIAGPLGAVAWWVRPDLLPFVLVIPLCLALDAKPGERRHALMLLGCAVCGLVLVLVVNRLYFGTALPLAFYAKGMRTYGPAIYRTYQGWAVHSLLVFCRNYWLLLAIAAYEVVASWRDRQHPRRALHLGLVLATAAFFAYHALMVLPIMSQGQRFFHPALPVLTYLAAAGVRRIPIASAAIPAPALRWAAGVLVVCQIGLLADARQFVTKLRRHDVGRFDRMWDPQWTRLWAGMDAAAALPDDLVVATTEVGLPGVTFARKRLIDLAGLNSPEFALHRFSADRLFNEARPDLLYLPYQDYAEMTQAIRSSPVFQDEYEVCDAKQLGSVLDVALWKRGRYYAVLRQSLHAEPVQDPLQRVQDVR